MTDMEVEENPVFTPYCLTKPNRKENNFESQLRDIDSAINYIPKEKDCIISLPQIAKMMPKYPPPQSIR
jgi:hypothetical protein